MINLCRKRSYLLIFSIFPLFSLIFPMFSPIFPAFSILMSLNQVGGLEQRLNREGFCVGIYIEEFKWYKYIINQFINKAELHLIG